MVEKTNAMRVLDARKVPYEIITFSPDIHSAEGVAEAAGISPAEVYKTLVVSREHGKPLLVMIAGDRELDLKRLARAAGEKKLKMATYRQAEELTGLQVGGISPLALVIAIRSLTGTRRLIPRRPALTYTWESSVAGRSM